MLRQFTMRKTSLLLALALVITAAATARFAQRSHAAARTQQQLTFEDRVAAQRAIEEVYHQHRIWPTDNPQPKPPLEAVMTEEALRAKVEDALRLSTALEVYWQRPVTAADLQAEVDRMARDTRQPEVLRELWAALGNDPCGWPNVWRARCWSSGWCDSGLRIAQYAMRDARRSA